ncbi:lysozyme g-like [Thalassophryne amazonica]|uniref:lysozyme g-like n=1 Tax=Thalassophryne amazonica TaxID=390379 RepID=UPI001470E326|nr:lysozyme g-like [Thalassophryne amazonica]
MSSLWERARKKSNMSFGDINKVCTSGASWTTAGADGRSVDGVAASHEMAASDLPHVNNYRGKIISAANEHGVQPAIVAGIISRETRGGRGAGFHNGWGDHGKAFGLMQVSSFHKPRGQWNSKEHISQGIEIFKGCYGDVERKFPSWTKEQKLKGALAAYNMGAQNMSPHNVDAHTTGGDYANDVTARAQYYANNGY